MVFSTGSKRASAVLLGLVAVLALGCDGAPPEAQRRAPPVDTDLPTEAAPVPETNSPSMNEGRVRRGPGDRPKDVDGYVPSSRGEPRAELQGPVVSNEQDALRRQAAEDFDASASGTPSERPTTNSDAPLWNGRGDRSQH